MQPKKFHSNYMMMLRSSWFTQAGTPPLMLWVAPKKHFYVFLQGEQKRLHVKQVLVLSVLSIPWRSMLRYSIDTSTENFVPAGLE